MGRPPSALPADAGQRGASGDVQRGAPGTPSFEAQEPGAARLTAPSSAPGAEHQPAALQVSGRQGDKDLGARRSRLAWKPLGGARAGL